MVGDGYCNDETNNIHCDFDGGDCCYSCVSTLFCTDCKCLTGNPEKEINHLLIGDGFCHDEINTPWELSESEMTAIYSTNQP